MIDDLRRRIVIFDFDGTIVYLNTDWEGLREKLRDIVRRTLSIDEPFSPIDAGLRRIKKLDFALFSKVIATIANHEIRGYTGKIVTPVVSFLKDHMATSQSLAIFSGNTRSAIESVLSRLDIHPTVIIGREDILDDPKPSPKGLIKIIEHFRVQSTDLVFIGDSELDLMAGRRCGVRTYLWRSLWT